MGQLPSRRAMSATMTTGPSADRPDQHVNQGVVAGRLRNTTTLSHTNSSYWLRIAQTFQHKAEAVLETLPSHTHPDRGSPLSSASLPSSFRHLPPTIKKNTLDVADAFAQKVKSRRPPSAKRNHPHRSPEREPTKTATMASKDGYPPAYPPSYPAPPQQSYQDPGQANSFYQSSPPPMGYPQQGHGGPYPPPDQYGGQPPYQQGGYAPQGYQQQPYPQQYQQYPPQEEDRGGSNKKGILGGLAAGLACCCCLDMIF